MNEMSDERLISIIKLLATPLDFESFISSGALSKAAGGWYKLEDSLRLPEHAWQQVSEIKSDTSTATPPRTYLKFKSTQGAAAKLYKQITGSALDHWCAAE
jgi:hypothetical protein